MTTLEKARATEKVVRMIEADNVLCFEVDRAVKKDEIKKEVEEYCWSDVQLLAENV